MRIEGLWGTPPPPVWPGSPQTALIFVGLPLLTALVLLATPLHDPGPPPPTAELTAPLLAEVSTPEPLVAKRAVSPAAMPRVVARRQRSADDGVPAVIYETRRTVHRSRAVRAPDSGMDQITLTASRRTAPSLGTQSP